MQSTPILVLRPILLSSFCLSPCLPIGLFPWGFYANTLYAFLFATMYVTLPTYLILLNPSNAKLNPICHLLALLGAHRILYVSRIRVNLITLIRFGEEYRSRSSSLCSLLLRTLFSNARNLCSSLSACETDFHTHMTQQGKITVMHTLIILFFDSKLEGEGFWYWW